jgi:hypothetical protein
MSEVPGGLGRLIEAEARLAQAVAAAEAEAATLLEAAGQAAAEEEARCRRAFESDAAALAERVATERDAEMARVTVAAGERATRLRELPASLVESLAIEVAGTILADLGSRVRS